VAFEEGTMEWDHHMISEGGHIPRLWGFIPTRVLAITSNAMGGPRDWVGHDWTQSAKVVES